MRRVSARWQPIRSDGGLQTRRGDRQTLPACRRAVETQKHLGQQSAMRIRPQAVSILLLLLRHIVHRHGDAHDRPDQTDGGRRLYRLQAAEDQAAERGQTYFDQDHARDPATDREPASGIADRGRFPAADRHPLRLYGRATLYMHIRARYSKYQKYLRLLAEELGIDFHLTSYVSRHTAAMTLQRNHIPREVISQMLGHADLETTNIYLDSFDNGVINEAAKVL